MFYYLLWTPQKGSETSDFEHDQSETSVYRMTND